MAAELVNRWSTMDLQRVSSLGYEPGMYIGATPGNLARGIAFPKNKNAGYQDVIKIQGGATLTTGIKFDFVLVDDGSSATDLGKVVVLGATVKKLVSGTDTLDITTGAGTEQTANVTLNGTSGVVTIGTVTCANATLDSAAAGDTVIVLLRRVGDNASDTCPGRVLCTSVTAYAY